MGQHQNIGGIGKAGNHRQNTSPPVQRGARRVKQRHARNADDDAQHRTHRDPLPVEQKTAGKNRRGIHKMQHHGCAGVHKGIGAEQQQRGQAAAHDTGHRHTGQSFQRDFQAALLPPGQQAHHREGKHIPQQNHTEGVDSVCVDVFHHQRHTAENHGTEDHQQIAFYHLSTVHDFFLLFTIMHYYSISVQKIKLRMP